MIHPYNGILLSNKQEQTINMYNNLYKSPGNQADWEKPILKCHILHDSTCVTFLKWLIIKMEKRLVVARGQDGGEERRYVCLWQRAQNSLWSDGNVLYLGIDVSDLEVAAQTAVSRDYCPGGKLGGFPLCKPQMSLQWSHNTMLILKNEVVNNYGMP